MPDKLFVAERLRDDDIHICIGLNPESLCGRNDICATVQIQKIDGHQTPKPTCDECIERFKNEEQDRHFEPTIICDLCDTSYSAPCSRVVTTSSNPASKICKPCYKNLLKEDTNGVDIPYEKAEPAY